MKSNRKAYLSVLAGIILGLLSGGCEQVYEEVTTQEEQYIYQLYNTTASQLLVEYELAGNNIIGNRNLLETIQPGETKKLWLETGEKDRMVSNYQELNASLSVFTTLKVTQKGKLLAGNQLAPARWQYKKQNLYKATYTLTVSQTDFTP